jgi:hypothetical protein
MKFIASIPDSIGCEPPPYAFKVTCQKQVKQLQVRVSPLFLQQPQNNKALLAF